MAANRSEDEGLEQAASVRSNDVPTPTGRAPEAAQTGSVISPDDWFRAVVNEHENAVFRYAHSRTRNKPDALDAAQYALLRVFRCRERLSRVDKPILGFLFRVVRHYLIDVFRRSEHMQTGRKRLPPGRPRAGCGMPPPAPLQALIMKERYTRLYDALDRLNRHHREAFLIYVLGDKTYEEVAQELGITPRLVRYRVFEARGRLRSLLRDMP